MGQFIRFVLGFVNVFLGLEFMQSASDEYAHPILKFIEHGIAVVFFLVAAILFISFILKAREEKKTKRENEIVRQASNQQMELLSAQNFMNDVNFDTYPRVLIDDTHKWFAVLYPKLKAQLYKYGDIIDVSELDNPRRLQISLNNVYNPCIILSQGEISKAEFQKLKSTLKYMQSSCY